ncbi:transketolase [candidate division WOR-3 bacterium RBG_13_43_14]|uniref:Transketolase n=1 Tax=candidate division WOR-3 bacterium RBG_13_43_14 TaxID=1802590 RepID=A0A1F4UBY4_UNCW3|nr:MAG: transketolase [candidate division WOR-3 bacterium RBG_13_43_14]
MNKTFREQLNEEALKELSHLCRGDILKMTTIAGSGHPAGSLSSIDIYLVLYSYANISPGNYSDQSRDRIVISHGHTSPGLYACLGRLGFFNINDVICGFRRLETPFEGHIERHIPGVEWTTGNLGQGLSAGCGFALGARLKKFDYHTFVFMSDAEQAKGMVGEARRFARKFNLCDLTVIIDRNHFQISGRTENVMPVNIAENYISDGWKISTVNGHNHGALYNAIKTAVEDRKNNYAIIAETIMGKGISFMENKADYHGKAATREECRDALKELGLEDNIENLLETDRKGYLTFTKKEIPRPEVITGKPIIYTDKSHPRASFGKALADIAVLNPENTIAVFDCDLADSVNVSNFAQIRPDNFFECGVSEHNTATVAGALSISGIMTVWADFGVFSIDEVYNQLRLNAINNTNLKVIATHVGFNVGSDGKTHQCIDYIGLARNLINFRLLIAADPNQADHITRFALNQPGNYIIALTRDKLPVIINDGQPFFNDKYEFIYGKTDQLCKGEQGAILTYGPMVHMALEAREKLKADGIGVSVYNISAPLHIDTGIIKQAHDTGLVVTYEDHIADTGLGSIVSRIMAENNWASKFLCMGATTFAGSDEAKNIYSAHKMDAGSLVDNIKKLIK